MSYSILRVSRVKSSVNTRGLQRHNQRENENYNNKDINHEETYKNYDLINQQNIDYNQKIEELIQENYTQKRKIRKDAVKHVDGLITSDESFFKELSEEDTKQFFKDSLSFLEERYGKENMLYATVHLDERTPHMHFGFVPITDDGRLSAKQMLGNKKNMTELQDDFNEFVNTRGYELKRGTSKTVSEKEHIAMDQFKKETDLYQKELKKTKKETRNYDEKLKQTKKDLKSLEKRLEAHRNVLKDSDDLEYIEHKNELKKVSKGLFSSEDIETGNKIISSSEFNRLQETVSSARAILDDYESLRDKSLEEQNAQLRDESYSFLEKNQKLTKENDKLKSENIELKSENEELKNFRQKAVNVYHMVQKAFPNFEKGFNKYKDAAQKIADKSFANNNLRTAKVMQDTVNFMQDVQDRVNQNQSEMTEDGFVKENVVKQKQSDLDL